MLNKPQMNNIKLISSLLQADLEKNGYVVLRSFLSAKVIQDLLDYYKSTGLNSDKTQPNYLYANPDLSKKITATIKALLQDVVSKELADVNFLGGVYMVKKPGQYKEVDFHQDWSLVNEIEHTSYNLWCPLVDTDRDSGSLMLMNKSDQAGLAYRSATLHPLEVKYEKKYEPFITSFELKAGDAILYKHSLFHGSGNNTGHEERIAIACGIIPQNAEFIYQHWNPIKSAIESYQVDNNFYIDHIFDVLSGNIPPKYKIVKETKFSQKPTINEAQFYKNMRKLYGLKRYFFFD